MKQINWHGVLGVHGGPPPSLFLRPLPVLSLLQSFSKRLSVPLKRTFLSCLLDPLGEEWQYSLS